LSYEEIGERVCPEVDPAGRGLRARRLHRIALVQLLRRCSRSLGGLESRPGTRGPGRTISRGCGDKMLGESVLIFGRPSKKGSEQKGIANRFRLP
jgi:hypothetical protein